MRIATQLKFISTATISVSLILAPLVIWMLIEFKNAKEDYFLVDKMLDNSFDRVGFRDQYFLYHEDRAQTQWDKNTLIANQLLFRAEHQFHHAAELTTCDSLRKNIAETAVIFHRIVNNVAVLKLPITNRHVYEELNRRLSIQLLLKAAVTRDLENSLHAASMLRVEQTYQYLSIMVSLFGFLLASTTILIAYHLRRQISNRIVALHDGARVIADGNLTHRITCTGVDELADLAHSINVMTGKLETFTQDLGLEIEQRKAMEDVLRKLSIAVEQSPASIIIVDLDACIEYVNPQFCVVTGYSANEVIGRNPRMFRSGQTLDEVYLELWATLVRGDAWHGELLNARKNGELFWEDTHIAPVKNLSGVITHFVAVKIEITKRKQMEEQIHQLAFFDPLTKLPNRRLLNDRLSQAMAVTKRHDCYGALMFLDLDNFKPVNDIYGHELGDLLLIEVAARLKGCVRESDTVARYGGDEFVILLNDLSADKLESTEWAEIVAEKICFSIEQPYLLLAESGKPLDFSSEHRCSASIGVSMFLNHEANQSEILKQADAAMYQAKKAGRNRIRFYGQN